MIPGQSIIKKCVLKELILIIIVPTNVVFYVQCICELDPEGPTYYF